MPNHHLTESRKLEVSYRVTVARITVSSHGRHDARETNAYKSAIALFWTLALPGIFARSILSQATLSAIGKETSSTTPSERLESLKLLLNGDLRFGQLLNKF